MDVNNEILDAIEIMVGRAMKNSAAIYNGLVTAVNADMTCVVSVNGGEYTVKYYGGAPTVNSFYQVFVPYSNMTKAFILVGGGGASIIAKSTIISYDAWTASTKTATIGVDGVTANNIVIVTAAPQSYLLYANSQIRCTAQSDGFLTFQAEDVPTIDVYVNVLIIG